MNFLELSERVIRKKVIRDGKRKVIKQTDNPNQKVVGGKAVKQTKAEQIKRQKSQRIGALKRKRKARLSLSRRKRSLAKRNF